MSKKNTAAKSGPNKYSKVARCPHCQIDDTRISGIFQDTLIYHCQNCGNIFKRMANKYLIDFYDLWVFKLLADIGFSIKQRSKILYLRPGEHLVYSQLLKAHLDIVEPGFSYRAPEILARAWLRLNDYFRAMDDSGQYLKELLNITKEERAKMDLILEKCPKLPENLLKERKQFQKR